MSNTMTFEEFDDKYIGKQIVDGFGTVIGTIDRSISCTCSITDDYIWEVALVDWDDEIVETEVREVTKDGKTTLVEVEQ